MAATAGIKAIFLDVDGVLNSEDFAVRTKTKGVIGIDPNAVEILKKIIHDTGAVIVLSSSWRSWPEGVKEVERHLGKLYGKTPLLVKSRGHEIQRWLDKHPEITTYAIIDDDSDFLPGQPVYLTDWQHGLTMSIASLVAQHLNGIEVDV